MAKLAAYALVVAFLSFLLFNLAYAEFSTEDAKNHIHNAAQAAGGGVFGDDDKPVGRKLMGEQIVVGVDLKYPGRIVKRVKPDPGESHESEGAGEPGVKGSGQ